MPDKFSPKKLNLSRRSQASGSFWQRLNRAVTEVGVEHFDDDRDWDDRVKLPEWQLARLKRRHAQRQQAPKFGRKLPNDG